MNLVITAVEHSFKYKRQKIEQEQEIHRIFEVEQELVCQEERNNEVSWNDLLQLSNDSDCSFRLSHIDLNFGFICLKFNDLVATCNEIAP